MKVVFYTQDFERMLYEFLEERLMTYNVGVIELETELVPEENKVVVMFKSTKQDKALIDKMKRQNLVESRKDGKVYLDMSYILRLSFSSYKVHSYGLEFTDPVQDGIVEYSFEHSKAGEFVSDDIQLVRDIMKVNAGSYIHALIKLNLFIKDKMENIRDYMFVGNSHPYRFIH